MPLIKKLISDHKENLGSLAEPATKNKTILAAAEICQRLKNQDFFSARMMVSSLVFDGIKTRHIPQHVEEIVDLASRVASAAIMAPIEENKTVNVQPIVDAYWIARSLMSTRYDVAEDAGRRIAAQVARKTSSGAHASVGALHADAVHLINRNNRQASILQCA